MKVVYIIYSHIHQAVKIGYASDLDSRLSTIQISTPEKLSLMFTFEGGKELEEYLHQRLNQFHIRGEWFAYNEVVKDFLLKYQEHQFELFTFRADEKLKHDLSISEEISSVQTINALVLEKAYALLASRKNRQYITIPDLKKLITSLDLTTKEIETVLLDSNWEIVYSGKCKTKFFRPANEN